MREEERQEVRKGKRGMGGKRRAEERRGSAEGKGREGGEEEGTVYRHCCLVTGGY